MKLLVYVTPWPENQHAVRGRSGFLADWFRRFLKNYYIGLARIGEPFEVKIIYPENDFLSAKNYPETYVEMMPIALADISDIFANHMEYMTSFIFPPLEAKRQAMVKFFKEKLDPFRPDIVIGLTPCDFFSELWPDALYLVMEAGFFSRPPYPPTQYFDSAKHLSEVFPARYRDEILARTDPREVATLLEPILEYYRQGILADTPLTRSSLDPDGRFRAIVMLPLQFEGCPSFDHCCNYNDQSDMVAHVAENIPADVLLIVTKHQFSVLDEEKLNPYFSQANVQYIDRVGDVRVNVSQRILPYVDGVITVSSSIGMQAVIWNKFCICIGNSHVRAFADSDSLGDLEQLIATLPDCLEKRRLVAYLFSHYYVPFDFLWSKPDWCKEYFQQKLDWHRSDRADEKMGFYPRIAENVELLDYYIPTA